MKIPSGAKLVMIGDSITDGGRSRPVGEGLSGALGTAYPMQVCGLLGTVYPERKIRVVNMGSSGNTVRDLKARWQTDVLDLKPDWLSVLIGINDIWRQHDSPLQTEIHVRLDEYRATLEELVAATRPSLQGLVLMSPFFIEPLRQDAMRQAMDRYGAAMREIAGRHDTQFVDLQVEFDRVLAHAHSAAICWDRVHPNGIGQALIARAFLKAVDFAF